MRNAEDHAKQLLAVERELENIKQAIRQGIFTLTTKAMLEDAERRYTAVQMTAGVTGAVRRGGEKLESILRDLPKRVQAYLADLETFLAQHIAEGQTILANLETEVLIRADGTAEIAGDLRKALALVVPKRDQDSVFRWSGEGESNPHPRLGRPELYL